MKIKEGGTAVGFMAGLVVGLLLALGVVLYVNHIPVPFTNKVPTHTKEQDAAEAQKNKDWDPNAPLYGKNPAVPRPYASGAEPSASEAVGAASGVLQPERPSSWIKSLGLPAPEKPVPAPAVSANSEPDPFVYYVQAGAFAQVDEAEQQRGKLTLLGLEPRISEREQAGRTVYRVRLGPFDRRTEADETKVLLAGSGVESVLVRVQR